MTSKKIVVSITPLEKIHPLVMILWTETVYNKETKKTFFYDKFLIRNFKLSKLITEKTNASVSRFEKNISGMYCDKCSVWESYLRTDELKIILKESQEPKNKFSALISNVCSSEPITDMNDQNMICIDLRRPEINGKEKVYLSDGSSMVFGKAADREAYSEYKMHMINGMKKYYSMSFKNIHPIYMYNLVEKIKQLTSDKKILRDIDYYYKIISEYRFLNVATVKSFEQLKENIANVMYSQKFIQQVYNRLTAQATKSASVDTQRKNLVKGDYNQHFPSM